MTKVSAPGESCSPGSGIGDLARPYLEPRRLGMSTGLEEIMPGRLAILALAALPLLDQVSFWPRGLAPPLWPSIFRMGQVERKEPADA
jgi:hypothetical protein